MTFLQTRWVASALALAVVRCSAESEPAIPNAPDDAAADSARGVDGTPHDALTVLEANDTRTGTSDVTGDGDARTTEDIDDPDAAALPFEASSDSSVELGEDRLEAAPDTQTDHGEDRRALSDVVFLEATYPLEARSDADRVDTSLDAQTDSSTAEPLDESSVALPEATDDGAPLGSSEASDVEQELRCDYGPVADLRIGNPPPSDFQCDDDYVSCPPGYTEVSCTDTCAGNPACITSGNTWYADLICTCP
jgi:hypothetical protein